jgi:hypothetical protein
MRVYHILLIGFLVLFCACQKSIELNNLIDDNAPLILKVKNQNESVTIEDWYLNDTINPNSQKWESIKDFLSNNKDGWEPSPVSYISDFWVEQNDFRLLGWLNGSNVVIGFKDNEGNSEQYSKKIKMGELDFLLK